MKHLGTVALKTPRLVLRQFSTADAEAAYKNWTGDPEVTKYLTWPTHESAEATRAVLAEWAGHYGEADWYQWAITCKENGDEPIGSIAVVKSDDDVEMAHIGYCIGRAWWNRGIMPEALAAVIRFLFMEVGVNRIEARHDPRNPGSGRVMQKCGMAREGTMREADRNNQGLCDAVLYAILRRDYLPPAQSGP